MSTRKQKLKYYVANTHMPILQQIYSVFSTTHGLIFVASYYSNQSKKSQLTIRYETKEEISHVTQTNFEIFNRFFLFHSPLPIFISKHKKLLVVFNSC